MYTGSMSRVGFGPARHSERGKMVVERFHGFYDGLETFRIIAEVVNETKSVFTVFVFFLIQWLLGQDTVEFFFQTVPKRSCFPGHIPANHDAGDGEIGTPWSHSPQ